MLVVAIASTAASAAGFGAAREEAAAVRRLFAAPPPPPPVPDGPGGVASAADRLGLLDGPAAGAGCVAPAGRAGVEASAGPARDRDLVVLVAMLHVVWCCNCKSLGFWAVVVNTSAEHWSNPVFGWRWRPVWAGVGRLWRVCIYVAQPSPGRRRGGEAERRELQSVAGGSECAIWLGTTLDFPF